ncbi:MAG: hypothetical protein ACHQ1H_01380 [Nitrososphaerales archaeon]
MRAVLYLGISTLAVAMHLGAMIVSSIAISGGAVEINPLAALFGPMVFQAMDFTLITGIAIVVWFLPIPSWVKITDISLLASSTSLDFVRDLVVFFSR